MNNRTIIGGIPYEVIGSDTSNLLIKCNGTARIQWGTKLIDLIKNGKIPQEKTSEMFYKGMVILFSKDEVVPDGWAVCDGKEYSYNGVSYKTPNLSDNNYDSLVFIIKL